MIKSLLSFFIKKTGTNGQSKKQNRCIGRTVSSNRFLDICDYKANIVLCYVMLCYVMLCYVICCVMLCYVMLCYDMLCYVMLCYVMLG